MLRMRPSEQQHMGYFVFPLDWMTPIPNLDDFIIYITYMIPYHVSLPCLFHR